MGSSWPKRAKVTRRSRVTAALGVAQVVLNSLGLLVGLLMLLAGAPSHSGENWLPLLVLALGGYVLLFELVLLATSFLMVCVAKSLSTRFQSVLMGLIVAGVAASTTGFALPFCGVWPAVLPVCLGGACLLIVTFLVFCLAKSVRREVRLALMGLVIGVMAVSGAGFSFSLIATLRAAKQMFAINPGNGPSELFPGEYESMLSEGVRRKDRGMVDTIVRDSQLSKDTALQYAARQGNIEMARYLIDKGATVDAVDDLGMTPMQRAIHFSKLHESGSLEVVKLLVEKGSDLSLRSADGLTVVQYAQAHGAASVQDFLKRKHSTTATSSTTASAGTSSRPNTSPAE